MVYFKYYKIMPAVSKRILFEEIQTYTHTYPRAHTLLAPPLQLFVEVQQVFILGIMDDLYIS